MKGHTELALDRVVDELEGDGILGGEYGDCDIENMLGANS